MAESDAIAIYDGPFLKTTDTLRPNNFVCSTTSLWDNRKSFSAIN